MVSTSAMQRVLKTPELLSHILSALPPAAILLRARGVNKFWKATIDDSPECQWAIWRYPSQYRSKAAADEAGKDQKTQAEIFNHVFQQLDLEVLTMQHRNYLYDEALAFRRLSQEWAVKWDDLKGIKWPLSRGPECKCPRGILGEDGREICINKEQVFHAAQQLDKKDRGNVLEKWWWLATTDRSEYSHYTIAMQETYLTRPPLAKVTLDWGGLLKYFASLNWISGGEPWGSFLECVINADRVEGLTVDGFFRGIWSWLDKQDLRLDGRAEFSLVKLKLVSVNLALREAVVQWEVAPVIDIDLRPTHTPPRDIIVGMLNEFGNGVCNRWDGVKRFGDTPRPEIQKVFM